VIQKVFRGHAVRKWTTRKIREIRAFRRELTRHIMNEVLHDVLEKEFVPDILVEIVTAMPPDIFAPHPAWLRDQLAAAEKITTETVTKLIREVVRETFNDLVNEYLMKERMEQKKKGTKTDQLAHYVELEIVQPVLKPILLTLARECIKEVAQEYLLSRWISDIIESMSNSSIRGVAEEALDEMHRNMSMEMICKVVVAGMCKDVAVEIYADLAVIKREKRELLVKQEMFQLSFKILDAALMRQLMDRIATGGEKAVVQQYTERTMDRLLYSLMLRRALKSEILVKSFESNFVKRYLMHKIMSKVLIGQLTGELTWLEGTYEQDEEQS